MSPMCHITHNRINNDVCSHHHPLPRHEHAMSPHKCVNNNVRDHHPLPRHPQPCQQRRLQPPPHHQHAASPTNTLTTTSAATTTPLPCHPTNTSTTMSAATTTPLPCRECATSPHNHVDNNVCSHHHPPATSQTRHVTPQTRRYTTCQPH